MLDRARINIEGLNRMIAWNYVNKVGLLRVGTGLIPRALFHDWRNGILQLGVQLADVKILAEDTHTRLTVHSGAIQMASIGDVHQQQARDHLDYLNALVDAVGTRDSVIEAHIGGLHGHKGQAQERAIKFLLSLPIDLRLKLALENDDKWDVPELMEICEATSTQFVYDIFHHKCWPGLFDYTDANIVRALWFARTSAGMRTPLVHISSQKSIGRLGAHAETIEYNDYVRLRKNFVDANMSACDIMIEAEAKEQALLALRTTIELRNPRWILKYEGTCV